MPTAPSSPHLLGQHPSIVALNQLIARVARSKAGTVLIYGETGTGKGLVARMIHQLSRRAEREFIDINCAAIPAELLESELFGHERGAFTGAVGKKEGLIEAANGGTVFLDEVRELDPVMQAKILTLLDTQRFRRVGAVKPIGVHVRFVAATNRILLSEEKAGKFRDDLYHRPRAHPRAGHTGVLRRAAALRGGDSRCDLQRAATHGAGVACQAQGRTHLAGRSAAGDEGDCAELVGFVGVNAPPFQQNGAHTKIWPLAHIFAILSHGPRDIRMGLSQER